jgi:hypothetical protein
MFVTAASTCEQTGASNSTGYGEEHTGKQNNYATNLNFRHFMEAEGSLPCSQEPITCSYRESGHSTLRPPVLFPFKLNSNIVLPFTSGYSGCQLKPACISLLPLLCHMPVHHILPYFITLIQHKVEYMS